MQLSWDAFGGPFKLPSQNTLRLAIPVTIAPLEPLPARIQEHRDGSLDHSRPGGSSGPPMRGSRQDDCSISGGSFDHIGLFWVQN